MSCLVVDSYIVYHRKNNDVNPRINPIKLELNLEINPIKFENSCQVENLNPDEQVPP